jgi:DNA-binding transcriptional ArsR family regulator
MVVFQRAGAPAYLVPVYAVLSDYANNRSGLAWPKMSTLADTLGISVRSVQRHLSALRELGLIEFVQRRRSARGRFSSWCYRLVLVASFNKSTTGHGRRPVKGVPYKEERKRQKNPPQTPQQSKEEQRRRRRAGGYAWLFGDGEAEGTS